MLGGRGDVARVAGLRRTTTGRLRPRRLRDGLQQPGGPQLFAVLDSSVTASTHAPS